MAFSFDQNLATPLRDLVHRAPVAVEADTPVRVVAQLMSREGVSSCLVKGEPPGIITDRDLRNKVVATGLSFDTPISQIASFPLKSLDSDTPVHAGLLLMLEANIRHLALVEEGEVVGVVSSSDLLRHQASNPIYLQAQLDQINNPKVLARYADEVARMVEGLARGGLAVTPIGRIVSSLNDTLISRLCRRAEKELGPPPVPYTWIVFGSEGRAEQLLLTDQDNALVYSDDAPAPSSYFSQLAEQVVNGLLAAGIPRCPGGYMATHWCKPLSEWIDLFNGWINTPEPEALMEAGIFFDFRPVHGALSLEPLEEVLTGANKASLFLGLMMREARAFSPPLGLFNRIQHEEGKVDLKVGGIAPITALARTLALSAGSRQRTTLERLTAAVDAHMISAESAELLADAFQQFLSLRLEAQLMALHAHQPLSNQIDLNQLSTVEKRKLKELFVTVRQLQEAISYEFRIDMIR